MNSIYRGEHAPCKECQKRFVGCHSQCATYMDYKQRREADRLERQKLREASEAKYEGTLRRKGV